MQKRDVNGASIPALATIGIKIFGKKLVLLLLTIKETFMKKVLTILAFLFFTIASMAQSVVIGTQQWMSRNLDVEFYRNGDRIPQVTDPTVWAALTTGAWCYYNNDPTQDNRYGKLYNWFAVNDPRGLAPQGWHIPSDAEWTTLETTLGGPSVAGGKMKEAGRLNWKYPNIEGYNTSGFAGLPGGFRNYNGSFLDVKSFGLWWSATEYKSPQAFSRTLNYDNGKVSKFNFHKEQGFSVRCLKD